MCLALCFKLFLMLALYNIVCIDAKKLKDVQIIVQFKPEECTRVAKVGDEVAVHYTGKLQHSGTVFDSSVQQGREPLPFTLGQKKVIPGWEKGILGMCVGEKRQLTIPPHLAYGKKGIPPTIPGEATLVFDTELVAIKQKGMDDFLYRLASFLAMPGLIIFIIFHVYRKYSEVAPAKRAKEERRGKKKRN